MSEDESSTTGGQQQNDADFDANNSIIDKVKSRVSSIFPQTLSKWFSPTTPSTDDNRNGNLRRRRDEQLDNEKRHQQNSDDSESDGGGSGSRSDADLILMPPSKKSRLNYNDHYQIMPPNRNLFASTPMVGGKRRENVELMKNTEIPYNYDTTSTCIGGMSVGDARGIDESRYIDGDVLDVVSVGRDWSNKKNISSRRSLNIPTTSSFDISQSSGIRHKNSKLYQNVQINESREQCVNLDNEDDDIGDVDNDDDEDDEKINIEIRKAQKQYLSNGLRQSIRRSDVSTGGNLNNSTGRISRSGGLGIGDSASESDESQCSSLIRQRSNIDKPKSGLFYPNLGTTMTTNSQSGSKRTSSMANGLNFYSHLEGKKSLFSEKNMHSILNNSTLSLTSLNRRQQFNASLYGSTSALSDSRLLNTISPFYKGRTTYGGASAYNKYAQLSQQQRQMRVTPTLMRPTSSLSSSSNNSLIQENNNPQNINNNTNNISSTAKRILELMDQFPTPLNEVKKMASGIKIPLSPAHKKRFSEADLIASRGIRLSKPLTPYSRPISSKQQQQTQSGQLPPPTSELHVPSMAQLLQLKRLQSNNEKLREIANSSKSILNQRADYKLPNETIANNNSNNNNISDNISGGKHINKMKNKITTTRQTNKNQQNEQQIPDIHLPNVQLPFMKSVPKIDITITPPLPTTTSEIIISPQSSNLSNRTSGIFNTENLNNKNSRKSDIAKYNISPRKPINQKELINTTKKLNGDIGEFIFSSPIKINDNQLDNININVESINNFKFSPPVAVDSLVDGSGDSTSNNNLILDQNKSAAMSLSFVANKNNSEILSSNLLKTTSSTTIPQLKTGSVLDALKKSTTNTSNTSVISATAQSLTPSGFGDKFKMSSNKWECSVCMIRNDETRNKCVACETPKSSTTSTEKSTLVPISTPINQKSTFGDVFKKSSDTWECDTCMVRNKNDVMECIACSAKKPGSIKSFTSISSTQPTTIVAKPLDVGFKNIVAEQTASKWECSACMTRNDSNRTKCICCEQAKSGTNADTNTKFSFGSAAASVPTTSQFKFGFGVDSSVSTEDLQSKTTTAATTLSTNNKTDEKPEEKFVFSGQNSAKDFAPSTKALTGFTFGFKTTSESTPVIPSNTVTVSSGTTSGFKFGVAQTTTSTISENKPIIQTKSTLLVTDKNSDNKPAAVTTSAPTMSLLNNTGFNFGVKSTGGLKFTENSPSSQKLSVEKISQDNTTQPTGSAFKSVGGFSFGPSNTKPSVTINETKSQLFGAVTTSAATESLKGFVFGGTTTTATTTNKSLVTTTVKKDEAIKLFSGFATPTSKITESVKTTPTMSQSTFSSSNFAFGDSSKNSANISASSATTAPATGFGSGNPSSNFVFGLPSAPAVSSPTTPLFGAGIVSPVVNAQSASTTTAPPPTFGSIKPTVTLPAASNQQPKPSSLFGSPNINSSNLGSTSTFGNNLNQSTIVAGAHAPTTSIFGSSFSASNLKSPSSLETPTAAVATSSAVTNQQPSGNVFSFGSGGVKIEPTTTTASIPTLFGNTSTSTTTLAPNSGFVFGAPKPIESTTQQSSSIFGTGMSANTNNTAFGSTTFGSVSNSNTNSAFGQSQPNVNPFGTSSTNTQQLHNSGFGTPVAPPAFGSSSSTSFGSSAPVQQPFGGNNNTSFGGFGNNNSNRINSDSGDCSATKKPVDTGFNFGAVAPQSSNTGFSFGSNNNNNLTKPAFNFSAPVQTPTPSFNFTGAIEANSSQPFQFGAPSNTANIQMPLFNNCVGNESTPNTPFQFNAANNIFAPTPSPGTPSAQQGRRKIRTATRRMNPRKTCCNSNSSTNSRTDEMTKKTTTIRTNLYKIKSENDVNDNDKQHKDETETIFDYKEKSLEKGQKNVDYNEKLLNDNTNDNDTNRNIFQQEQNQKKQQEQQNLFKKSSIILAKQDDENILTNNKIIVNDNVILRSFLFTNLYNKKIQQLNNNNNNSLNKYENININNNNNEICNTTKPSVEISSNLFNNNYINNEINKKFIYNTTQRKMFSNLKKKYHNKMLSSINTSKLSILHNNNNNNNNNHPTNRYKFIRKSSIIKKNLINDIEINKKDEFSNNNINIVTSPLLSVSQQKNEKYYKLMNMKNIRKMNDIKMKNLKANINLYGHNKLILNKGIITNRTDIIDKTIRKSKYHYIKPKE